LAHPDHVLSGVSRRNEIHRDPEGPGGQDGARAVQVLRFALLTET